MSLNQEVDILRNIPLFARIEPAKLKLLAFTSERVSYNAGDVLFKQGDMGDAAYIVIDGAADVLVDTPNGQITVATVGKNDIVGEIAILCDVPRTATVKATAPLTSLRVSKELFFQMINEFPQMAVEVMRELAHRLDRTTSQLREAMTRGNKG